MYANENGGDCCGFRKVGIWRRDTCDSNEAIVILEPRCPFHDVVCRADCSVFVFEPVSRYEVVAHRSTGLSSPAFPDHILKPDARCSSTPLPSCSKANAAARSCALARASDFACSVVNASACLSMASDPFAFLTARSAIGTWRAPTRGMSVATGSASNAERIAARRSVIALEARIASS